MYSIQITKKEMDILDLVVNSEIPLNAYKISREEKSPSQPTVFRRVRSLIEKGLLSTVSSINEKGVNRHDLYLTNMGLCEYILHKKAQKSGFSNAKTVALLKKVEYVNLGIKYFNSTISFVKKLDELKVNKRKKDKIRLRLIDSFHEAVKRTVSDVNNDLGNYVECDRAGDSPFFYNPEKTLHDKFFFNLFDLLIIFFPKDSISQGYAEVSEYIILIFKKSKDGDIIIKQLKEKIELLNHYSKIYEDFQNINIT